MRRLRSFILSALAVVAVFACGRPDVPRASDIPPPGPIRDAGTGAVTGGPRAAEASAVDRDVPASAAATDRAPLVVFLGDSLTAGYGLSADEAYPAHVADLLAAEGVRARILNAGVSGDTSAGGLERLDWFLRQRPDVVVVELGGNDGLRGQPLEATEANLRAIVRRSREAGARVLLVGMQIPPNYGPEYADGFAELFSRLAREEKVALLPFLLEGVAADPALNQPDGIHPNAEGQKIVARTVVEALKPLLADLPVDAGVAAGR